MLKSDCSQLATVSVNMSGQPAGFVYATLSSPVVLTGGTDYVLQSLESSGGDTWYDDDTTLTLSADFGACPGNTSVYLNCTQNTAGAGCHSYVPVSLLYAN